MSFGKDTGVFTIHDAVPSLRPNSAYTIESSDNITHVITWDEENAETEPTQSEIDAEIIRLQAEWVAQEYARKRKSDYPSTGDQLDMMYKDNLNSTTTHKDAVEAVKTKWPKDNSGPV